MKIEEFITQWAQVKVEDPTIIIPTTEEVAPVFRIITNGNSKTTTATKCYNWSCTDRALYYKDTLVSYKQNGIFLSNEAYTKQLLGPFENLGIISYSFQDNITEYESLISKALTRFYECTMEAQWIDDIILQLVQTLNIRYENKYLNYCRGLNVDQFREVTKKHNSRKPVVKKRTFTGLWYK